MSTPNMTAPPVPVAPPTPTAASPDVRGQTANAASKAAAAAGAAQMALTGPQGVGSLAGKTGAGKTLLGG